MCTHKADAEGVPTCTHEAEVLPDAEGVPHYRIELVGVLPCHLGQQNQAGSITFS